MARAAKVSRPSRAPAVGFLVGSGVSCAAGLPSVAALTDCILSDDEVPPRGVPARRFLRILAGRIEESVHRVGGRPVNYEERPSYSLRKRSTERT